MSVIQQISFTDNQQHIIITPTTSRQTTQLSLKQHVHRVLQTAFIWRSSAILQSVLCTVIHSEHLTIDFRFILLYNISDDPAPKWKVRKDDMTVLLHIFTSLKWTSCMPTSSIIDASSSMLGVTTLNAEQPCLNMPSQKKERNVKPVCLTEGQRSRWILQLNCSVRCEWYCSNRSFINERGRYEEWGWERKWLIRHSFTAITWLTERLVGSKILTVLYSYFYVTKLKNIYLYAKKCRLILLHVQWFFYIISPLPLFFSSYLILYLSSNVQ